MNPISNFVIELFGWLFRLFGAAAIATLVAQITWLLFDGQWQSASGAMLIDALSDGPQLGVQWLDELLAKLPLSLMFAGLSVVMLPTMIVVVIVVNRVLRIYYRLK